jgi:hypothetical protein
MNKVETPGAGQASRLGENQAAQVLPFPSHAARPQGPSPQVSFNRPELQALLNLYGRMVAEGEWRDYAIDFGRDRAVFAVYRRASESPLFRIVKDPRLARRQGAYWVETTAGQVLKRGHDLARVLRVLETPLRLVPN